MFFFCSINILFINFFYFLILTIRHIYAIFRYKKKKTTIYSNLSPCYYKQTVDKKDVE